MSIKVEHRQEATLSGEISAARRTAETAGSPMAPKVPITRIDQSRAVATTIVAGDLTQNYFGAQNPVGVVEQLLQQLKAEMEKNEEFRDTVEALKFFYEHRASDGVVGLENKLSRADRKNELLSAMGKKELFAKLLVRWSKYASAQEIFAYLLAEIEHHFTMYVIPELDKKSQVEINTLIEERVVLPAITQCRNTVVFTLNHSHVMGMVYWLAEQCFVRWHP